MIDVTALKDWLGLIALLISIGTSVVLFVGSGSKRNSEKLEKQEAKLTDHDRRIQRLESDIAHLPSRDATHKMELALAEISGRLNSMEAQIEGRLSAMDERLKPISSTTLRLQEFLLENAK